MSFPSTKSKFGLVRGISGYAFSIDRVSRDKPRVQRIVLRDNEKNQSCTSYSVISNITTNAVIFLSMNPPLRRTPESLGRNDAHVLNVIRARSSLTFWKI